MPTKQELQDLADEHGVEVSSGATKAELVDALKEAGVDVLAETGEDEDVEDENGEEAAPAVAGDAALTDPGALAARFEGTTSDPATREEGTAAADVGADPAQGDKPSDAGAEAYPFPPGGDVEVALLSKDANEGEWDAPLNVEDWVVLDGSHEDVPDRLDGHIASVVKVSTVPAPDADPGNPNAARVLAEDEPITVRTRDEVNATLVIPLDAVKEVGRGGRHTLQPTG